MIKGGFLEWMVLCVTCGMVIGNAITLKEIKHQVNEIICVSLEMDK